MGTNDKQPFKESEDLLVSNWSLAVVRSNSPRTTERSSFVESVAPSLTVWLWSNRQKQEQTNMISIRMCKNGKKKECVTTTYLTQWAAVTTQLRAIRVAPHPPDDDYDDEDNADDDDDDGEKDECLAPTREGSVSWSKVERHNPGIFSTLIKIFCLFC